MSKREVETDQILFTVYQINQGKLCSLAKTVLENKLIVNDFAGGELLLGVTPFNTYLEQEVYARYPVLKIRAKSDPRLWDMFFSKYAFMVKDELYNALRNQTRQKRYLKRYFANLKTVLAEACNADCMYNGTDRPMGNPALEPCELIAVSMGLAAAIRNLNLAFTL